LSDGTGRPNRILLLGGSSEIGVAICSALAAGRPGSVLLAGRPSEQREAAAASLTADGLEATQINLDIEAVETHDDFIRAAFSEGDIDVAVIAFGSLGEQSQLLNEPDGAVAMAQINFTGPMSLGLRTANAMSRQGRGTIIVLSSVAALAPRPANFVYGATKAGLDALFVGLTAAVRETGVAVHVVRAGFVRTRMTSGQASAPFATTPARVAKDVVGGMRRGSTIIWTPRVMQPIGIALNVLPQRVINRMKA
jgi:decaprenylphospho-beta-D-erythro-pentofuranosid-2-ulose 2-reductase